MYESFNLKHYAIVSIPKGGRCLAASIIMASSFQFLASTAECLAAALGRVLTCSVLIKFGALVSFKNSDGKPALLLAKKGASFDAACLLVEEDNTFVQ